MPFRLSPLAAFVTGLSILASIPAHAADDKLVAELQAEIARLKQEIAAQKGQLAAPAPAINPVEAPAPAAAPNNDAQTLDTVVVRGRNRLERLQDVPVSISVVTGAELDRLQARDLSAITQRTANIAWNNGNARTSSLSIRGIGKQSQTDAMDPSVGVTVDGVSYAYNPLANFDFFDIDAVEVLRGPQGTLYGKNASVGALNITTKRPTFTPDNNFSLALGEQNRVIGSAALGGPIVDGLLAWRGAFSVDKGQGYFPNSYNETQTYKNKDNVGGRIQLLLTPTADFDATLKVEFNPRHEDYSNGWSLPQDAPTKYPNGNKVSNAARTALLRPWFADTGTFSYQDYLKEGYTANDQRALVTGSNRVSTVLNWRVANHTLTSITGYTDFYFQARNDEGTPFDVSKNGGGYVALDQQVSQELRLTSEKGGLVDYQTGLYWVQKQNNYNSRTGFGSDAGAWFASDIQYGELSANGTGRSLLENSIKGLETSTPQHIRSQSTAAYGQANWHLVEDLTLTTGLRFTLEKRENTSEKFISSQGFGAEFNSASLGGFSSVKSVETGTGANISCSAATIAGCATTDAGYLSTTNATQIARANAVAQKYFGVNYAALTPAQARQIQYAKDLRSGQMGKLYGLTHSETIDRTLPTLLLSPSYKINENLTTYVSLQYGKKAGIAQVVNGTSYNAKEESTTSYELGLKSVLLDRKLTLNTNVYLTDIKNYQQGICKGNGTFTTIGSVQVENCDSVTGNAAGARSQGLEIDGVFTGIPNTVIRFSGAYNDAYYTDFKDKPASAETKSKTILVDDATGQTLPGASKITWNIGAEYAVPLFGRNFHAGFNTAYNSKFNSDTNLSAYGWIKGSYKTDLSIGLGSYDKKFDVSLLAKNVFDDQTPTAYSFTNYTPGTPRWLGIVFSGKL